MTHTLKIFAAAGLVLAAAVPANAYWDPNTSANIADRHPQAVVDILASQGVKVERLEERNELVLAFVLDDAGQSQIQFFDPDNGFKRVFPGGR